MSIIIVIIDNFLSHVICPRAVFLITGTCVQYSKLTVLDGWLRSLFSVIRILDWCLTLEIGGSGLNFNGRMCSPSAMLAKAPGFLIDYYNLRLQVVTCGLGYESEVSIYFTEPPVMLIFQ